MSYTSVIRGEEVTRNMSGLTTVRQTEASAAVATRSNYRADRNSSRAQTYILITQEVARLAGLRAGQRVSILQGTGRDAGKYRIVANSEGTYKIGKSNGRYALRIRTQKLLRYERATTLTRVTSYGKGVLTIAI